MLCISESPEFVFGLGLLDPFSLLVLGILAALLCVPGYRYSLHLPILALFMEMIL